MKATLLQRTLVVSVACALLAACGGGGVEKPNLNVSAPTNSSNSGTGSAGNGGTGGSTGDTLATDAKLSVAITAFSSRGYATHLTENDVNGGQVVISLTSAIPSYKAPKPLTINYTTVCSSGVNNPASYGTDFSLPRAVGSVVLPNSDNTVTVNIITDKQNPSPDDTNFCFSITGVDGLDTHALITQSDKAKLSAVMTIKNTTTTTNPNPQPTPTPAATKSMVNTDSTMKFVKLDNTGNKLADDASDWQCFGDETTGLIWETKRAEDDVLQSIKGRYAYHDTARGYGETTLPADWRGKFECTGMDDKCTTQAYIDKMNADKLCGIATWRLPTYHELFNITNLRGTTAGAIWPQEMIAGNDTTAIAAAYSSIQFWTSSPMNSNAIGWRGADKLADDQGEPTYKLAYLSRTGALGGTLQDPPKNYSANTSGVLLVADK
ncbi:MAG: DUF1566 domain-containing protein [Moraxella sp.]|nr:DUF1566 domain-containing protein [Moraxella sp.]